MRPGAWVILRRLRACWVLLAAGLAMAASITAASVDEARPPVLVAHLQGAVDPVTARYVHRAVSIAERERAPLLVITVDTPGGLDTSMRQMVQDLLNATVPTVAFIWPSGARAASAGVFVAEAANLIAMAPGTNIGAAHPIEGSGASIQGDLRDKITNDAAAYIAGIAKQRGRNDAWVQDAVRKSASIDAQGAVDQHVADVIAPDLPQLLRAIDGRAVTAGAESVTLHTLDATVRTLDMNPIETIFHKIFDPNVAYLLLTVGFYALLIELFHPGALAPGFTGIVCLVLAFVALAALPMNWGGVLLILAAVVLFVVDVKAATHGALTLAGLACFVLGSLLLYSPPGPRLPSLPDVAVAPSVLVAASASAALISILIVATSLRIRGRGPINVTQRLDGATGVSRTALEPGGTVRVGGQTWSARLRSGTLGAGQAVRVLGRKGLTLEVEPADSAREQNEQGVPP